MKYAPLLLLLEHDVLYSPASLTVLAKEIGFFPEGSDGPDQREHFHRLRLMMTRQLKHFPQKQGRPVPDGQFFIEGLAPLDGWLGWRWIRLVLEKELLVFATLFLALEEEALYTTDTLAEFALANDLHTPGSDNVNTVPIGKKELVGVARHLLANAPSSPFPVPGPLLDPANVPLSGKRWHMLADEFLDRSVFFVLCDKGNPNESK